jgi:aspartyl-tRNA(Asn)/glutamyl-tRNA(Gln) amidotransferase subunit A
MEFKSTKEKIEAIKNKKLSAEKNVSYFLENIEKHNKEWNIYLFINPDAKKEAKEIDRKIKEGKAGKLAGLCFAVKACINVKGMPASCASKTLENYIATYDSDVIKKLKSEDAIVLGIVNMDEFACGISGETSAFGPTINPIAPKVVPGGSSSGSAAAVAGNLCDFALGTDTGGSVRNPASHCGIIGIKPSYGRVSRFGLIDLAMSFDQIGVLSKDTYTASLVLEIMAGKSQNDPSTSDIKVDKYSENLELKSNEKIKIGFFELSEKLTKDKDIFNIVKQKSEELAKKLNTKLKSVNLQYTDLAVQTYYPIVYVEFFSGTRKLDGRKYGLKIEDSCGTEALRRILGGLEISKAEYGGSYYKKALAAKKLVQQDFESIFKEVDVILLPVTPMLPNKLGENLLENNPEVGYAFDAFTTPANLAGICGGVIKAGEVNGIPIGIQVLAPTFKEKMLFSILNQIENL